MALVSMPQTTPEKDEKGRYGSFYLKGYWSTHGIGSRFKDNSGEKKTSGQWKEFFTFQERLIIEYNVIVQSCFEHGYKTRSPEEVDAGMRRAILMVHDQGFCEQKRMLEGEKQEKNRVQRNVAMVDAQKANPGTHFHTVAEPASGDAQLKIIKTGYEIHRCILSDLIHTSGLAKTDPGWLREALDAIFFVTSYNSVGDKSIPLLINKKIFNIYREKNVKYLLNQDFLNWRNCLLQTVNHWLTVWSLQTGFICQQKRCMTITFIVIHSWPWRCVARRLKMVNPGSPKI